ncbi:hypothetical protein FE257_010802 [Aspergillus nanangensis]|uniref:Uncharacterized protein n=1 Tax=Aspergillus nanangensis TaxID=2582783 RepID=A0AAD4CVI4_ASPNN|nr:hypothetical protein FE257_010802 [Aspergillus nanangensis]
MDTLPFELVRELCLTLKDDGREALRALTLVNSRLYSAAAPVLCDTVLIRFTDLADLRRITAEYTETGLGRQFLTNATRLEILAFPNRFRGLGRNDLHDFRLRDLTSTLQDFLPSTVGPFMEDLMPYFDLPGYRRHFRQWPGYYHEKDWEPLVSLIAPYRIPSSITCAEDPFDMEILRSPSLCAINIDYPEISGAFGTDNARLHEIIYYVNQAPNLKHLHLRLDSQSPIERGTPRPRVPSTLLNQEPLARLHSFSIQSNTDEQLIFWQWNQTADFSTLRSLRLPRVEFPLRFKDAAAGLVSLERLSICVQSERYGRGPGFEELRCIFQRLRPLKYLALEGLDDVELLHTILERHGPSLIGLMFEPLWRGASRTYPPLKPQYTGWLYPLLDDLHLRRLAVQCPRIIDLRVPVRRSKGNRMEVSIYRALGSFSHLQNLILDLYGNPRPVLSTEDGLYTDEAEGLSPMMHVTLEDAFINFATDSTLAQSIWTEIFSSQPSRKLAQLRVSPWGYNDMPEFGELHAALTLAQSFLVTHGGKDVTQIGREEKEAEQAILAEEDPMVVDEPDWVPFVIPDDLLNSIWPPTSEAALPRATLPCIFARFACVLSFSLNARDIIATLKAIFASSQLTRVSFDTLTITAALITVAIRLHFAFVPAIVRHDAEHGILHILHIIFMFTSGDWTGVRFHTFAITAALITVAIRLDFAFVSPIVGHDVVNGASSLITNGSIRFEDSTDSGEAAGTLIRGMVG